MNDSPPRQRLLAALAAAATIGCVGAALALIRYVFHAFGFVLSALQREALVIALVMHTVIAAGCLLSIWLVRNRRVDSPTPARLVLAALPVVLLISADRLAAIAFVPIRGGHEMLQRHPVRVWTNRPGAVVDAGDRVVRINTLGLRGPELPVPKPAGEERILFLGDSVAFGIGLAEADCFVWQFEAAAGQRASDRAVRVINCSVTAYSPWQEADLLEAQCLSLAPDVVVQVFCLNDLVTQFRLRKFGGATDDIAPVEPAALEWSGLFRMIRAAKSRIQSPGRKAILERESRYSLDRMFEDPDALEMREARRVTLASMAEIQAICRRAGVPLAIVCFPYGPQITDPASKGDGPQRALESFAAERDIPFLDLLPVYQRIAADRSLVWQDLFPDSFHPTPEANALAADAILRFLVREGLVR
jgi:lysophospholipase L1-like esterase